jgi:hypothetical protein
MSGQKTTLMTLEEEITKLTAAWCKFVSVDHHKDRDMHFYVQKNWSYGEAPTYSAHHHGYIGKNYDTKTFETEEDALMWMKAYLINDMNWAIKHLEGTEYWDENDKVGFPSYELMGLTKQRAADIVIMLKEALL